MNRLAIGVLLSLLWGQTAPDARSAEVTLQWDYPYSGAAGFALYCGEGSRSYTSRTDLGFTDIHRFDLPEESVDFCAVVAYDYAGRESDLSNEIGIRTRAGEQVAEALPQFSVREAGWVQPTPTGAQVHFSLPIDATRLNLYRGYQGQESVADFTLVGANTRAVSGSLVVDPDRQTVTFLKTGGVLAPDTYTLTIAGRPDSVVDIFGRALDGDAHAGQDYRVAFAVAESDLPVLSIGEFARGPGQVINLPASDASAGIPVSIARGAAIHDVTFALRYDPTLLSIQGVTLGISVSGTLADAVTDPAAGLLRIRVTDLVGLSNASTVLVRLQAQVPSTAPYFRQQILDLRDVSFNGNSLGGIDDDGLQLVAKVGDVSGDAFYSSFDAYMLQRLILRIDTGFSSFPTIDPLVIGDVNNNGWVDSNDVYLIQLKALRYPVPQIPD